MLSILPLRCLYVLLLLVAALHFPQSSGQSLLSGSGSSRFSSIVEKEIYSIARELFVSRFSAFEREMINQLHRVKQDILQVKIDNEAAVWKQRYLDLSKSVQDLKLSVNQLVTERNLNNAHIQSSIKQHNMTDAISVTTRNEVSVLQTEVTAMTIQMADKIASMKIRLDEISGNVTINSNKTNQISVENRKIRIKLEETESKLWNIENKTEHYLQDFQFDASQQLKAIQSEISALRNSKNSNETAMLGNLITFAVSLNKLNKNVTINRKNLELVLEEQTRQNRTINSIIKQQDFLGTTLYRLINDTSSFSDDYQTTERTTSQTHESSTMDGLNEALCTFEPQEDCFLENSKRDDFDWTTQSGSTPSSDTGPSSASSGSYYSYIEVSDPRKSGDTASLVSKELIKGGEKCIRFDYHMRGNHIGTLKVFRFKEANGFSHEIFSRSGEQGSDWNSAAIPLTSAESYKLRIDGIKGSDFKGDIAIDNVGIVPGKCDDFQSTEMTTSQTHESTTTNRLNEAFCSFEPQEDCFLENSTRDDFDWTTQTGSTSSSGTGPSAASSGVYYSYIEVSDPRKSGDTASLVSKGLITGGEKCFRFDYHMRGKHMGTLKVFRFKEVNGGGFSHEIFSRSGEQGSKWNSAAIPLTSVESYKLRIDGIKGSDFKGDIAIDNVRIVPGKCDVLPVTGTGDGAFLSTQSVYTNSKDMATKTDETFFMTKYILTDKYKTTEKTINVTQVSTTIDGLNEAFCTFEPQEDCFLENSTRDDFDWNTGSGGTPSSGTGPSRASSGLYYSYIEVSDPRKSGDTASLMSKVLISGGEKCMRFDYHMRGKHMGTLKVFRFKEGNDGGFNHEIFSVSGEQGSDWYSEAIPLTSVESYKLRIDGIKGSDFKGDIAIDNIRIVPGKCDNCSSGWIAYGSSCYKFIESPLKTWSDAKAYCSTMKSNLVEIENSSENNFLRKYLGRLSNTGNINDLVNQFWIGNSDIDNEGVWTWATSGSRCGYTDWTKRTNEPNGGRNENCGTMAAKLDYHWNDSECSLKLKFICENHI